MTREQMIDDAVRKVRPRTVPGTFEAVSRRGAGAFILWSMIPPEIRREFTRIQEATNA